MMPLPSFSAVLPTKAPNVDWWSILRKVISPNGDGSDRPSAAAILAKANSTDPEKLIAAAEGLSLPSPFGEMTFRKIDHQSTLGAFVGKTALKDGKGVMVDSVYRKGADYLPTDAEVEKLRPKD